LYLLYKKYKKEYMSEINITEQINILKDLINTSTIEYIYQEQRFLYDYKVNILAPKDAVRIDFRLGFRVEPRIQLFFNKILEELVKNGEINVVNHYEYKKRQNVFGDVSLIWHAPL
jgi:hypothetical protein